MMRDDRTIVRQWLLLNLLGKHEHGMTIQELAASLRGAQRTVQRDIDDLVAAGFPLEFTREAHGRKRWTRVAGLIPSINLTLTEAAALYLSRKLMEPLAGTYLWTGAQEAFQKFECTFDKKTLKYLDKLARTFHPTQSGTGDYSAYGEIIDTLMLAIEDHKVVTFSYQSQRTTEPAERDVHPYCLVYHKGTLYLIAWAVEHREFRNYKVDRISNPTFDPKSLPFVPVDFQREDYLAGSFGIYHGKRKPTRVRIRFQSSVVRYVEEKHWHDTQTLLTQPDGSLLAEFTLTDLHEVKSWVLSFGPNARVLEPPELVEEIRDDLRQAASYYETVPPSDRPAGTTEQLRRKPRDKGNRMKGAT